MRTVLRGCFTLLLLFALLPEGLAHSGKARFHVIVDTDGAADDLRAISMLLGNREAEVLAITTSEGALAPPKTAERVATLLREFRHEGIPVGAGRTIEGYAPPWRQQSAEVSWGDTTVQVGPFAPAPELIARTLRNEEERVVFVALGALTNLADLLDRDPELAGRIERIVWYNDSVEPLAGPNYEADSVSAHRVLKSGIPMTVVASNTACPMDVTPAMIDSIATVPGVYARTIARTHRTAPLAQMVREGHLKAWDELTVLYLFAPELFDEYRVNDRIAVVMLPDRETTRRARARLMEVLRGKPDSESRVFYGFPTAPEAYADDVAAILDETIGRYGPSEWRAGVLTNELHGHLGIYAIIGVKMGIRAREYFNIGVDDIEVTTWAGRKPPVSCMNDGLQVGTGATLGHGLIAVAGQGPVRPEARFKFKDKTIRLVLKPEYAERIRRDVCRGIEQYGNLTEPYWNYIRALALQYWRDFDRHELFDLYVEEA